MVTGLESYTYQYFTHGVTCMQTSILRDIAAISLPLCSVTPDIVVSYPLVTSHDFPHVQLRIVVMENVTAFFLVVESACPDLQAHTAFFS